MYDLSCFCRHKVMLHFRMFSDYIYTQNPMGLQAQIKMFPFAVIKYLNIFKNTTFSFLSGLICLTIYL